MRKNIIAEITFVIVLIVSFSIPFFASAFPLLIPFGGKVTSIQPCDSGILAWVLQPPSPTQPVPVPKPFMWLTGELPFLNHVVPHPGQNLLGEATSILSPCVVGNIPYGFGFPIDFHGSSF